MATLNELPSFATGDLAPSSIRIIDSVCARAEIPQGRKQVLDLVGVIVCTETTCKRTESTPPRRADWYGLWTQKL